MNCYKGIGVAGLVVMLAPVLSRAAVIFEFKDVAPGIGAPNSIDIHPGDTFSFAAWFHADGNEHVNGLSFLIKNADYSDGDKTFTLNGLPDMTGSSFAATGIWTGHPQPLTPDNYDALALPAPHGTDLGSSLSGVDDWRSGDQYVGRITLTADPALPVGSYLLTPNSNVFSWQLAGGGPQSFDGFTGYTVNVVPEPSEYAIIGAAGLLGFAAYRRFSQRQN